MKLFLTINNYYKTILYVFVKREIRRKYDTKSQIIDAEITDQEFILFCTRSSVRKTQLFWIVLLYIRYHYSCISPQSKIFAIRRNSRFRRNAVNIIEFYKNN